MKKSIRILSILMAFAMLIGSFTVMGNAYQAYKGSAISGQYNDVDSPDFTLEQYASMGLDEVDRMLAKEKLVLNVYIGTLDVSSINTAITSLKSLLTSVSTLLPMLGDAATLPDLITPLDGIQRFDDTDLDVVYALFDTIANLSGLVEKYVNGSFSLGIMNGFVADYVYNVRELAIGFLFSETNEGKAMDYDYFSDGFSKVSANYRDESNGTINVLQTLLNEAVLGEWKLLDEYFTDPYSAVNYNSYSFKADYGETTYDTDSYDYYGWVHRKDWVTVGLGGCVRVPAGEDAPDPDFSLLDVRTDKIGYDFVEDLMQRAYNYVLVPVLNRDTRPWLRKLCGVYYDSTKTSRGIYNSETQQWENNPNYDPTYDGEVPDELTSYGKLFNVDAYIPTVTVPEGETFVDNFNDILGDFVDHVLITARGVANEDGYSWNWTDGDNSLLITNVASVARFVVQVSGDLFFSEIVDVPTPAEVADMTDQQIISFILRAVLNSSVDYINVEDTYQSIAEVAYRAVEQLAWQDIPQMTYTMPSSSDYSTDQAYYDAVVEKMIDILFDIAVYNLNQNFDMVPESGNDPYNGAGLLPYLGDDGDYRDNMIQIVAWAFKNYAPILALTLSCYNETGSADGLTEDMVWSDFDTIINSLIPIKGDGAWINAEIAGDGSTIVSKTFVFDYLLKPIYYLNATNLAKIFERNPNGAFATENGVNIIMDILENVANLLFPGVFQRQSTVDGLLNNDLLASMASDLIKSLGTKSFTNSKGATVQGRAKDIVVVALPLVCQILGLSDAQEFEEMEIYMPENISTSGDAPTFEIYNGSSGINTGYTAKDGTFTQDELYTYEITSHTIKTYDASGNDTKALSANGITTGATIAGGDKINVTLTGTRTAGCLVELTVNYKVKGEKGTYITDSVLSKTVYAYVGDNAKDDDSIESSMDAGSSRTLKYEPSIYMSTGRALDKVESYSIRVKDNSNGSSATASVSSVAIDSTSYPFVTKNTTADEISVSMDGNEGLYFLNPFQVAMKTDTEEYARFAYEYEKDENNKVILYQVDEYGNFVTDANGDRIVDEKNGEAYPISNNAGVPDGKYTLTTVVNVGGTNSTVTTNVFLYDDYGLPGLFESAVSANRQQSGFSDEYEAQTCWNAYQAALKNAAILVLKPKTGSTFMADIAATDSNYSNKYEQYARQLKKAIADLDAYALNSGVDGLKDALNAYSGFNYTIIEGTDGPYTEDIDYDSASYIYFGMRDYVPHTYNTYKNASKRANKLIDSLQKFVSAPIDTSDGHIVTDEEQAAYDESVAAYQEWAAESHVVGAIDATYAIYMVNLAGERLIRLPADTSKLQLVYDQYSGLVSESERSKYTPSSLDRYDRAVAFAASVLAEDIYDSTGEPALEPSKVNMATTELIKASKKLAEGADYTALNAAIANAKTYIDAYGLDAEAQTAYTVESYQVLADYYVEASNLNKELAKTTSNQERIDKLTLNLNDAIANLETATSKEVVIELVTEDPYCFFDHSYGYTFTPAIYGGDFEPTMWGATTSDGTEIDAFIIGVGVYMSEDDILNIFSRTDNVTIDITPSSSSGCGSGTIVQFYNTSTGALEKTYMIVLLGDANGDGEYNSIDVAYIKKDVYGDAIWLYEPETVYKAVASDVNGNGEYDAIDISNLKRVVNGEEYTIDQANSGVIAI
ncbi:MAG: dockerin type I repeat-containing protein [Acutalibacteraceae bacterium]